MGGTKMMPNPPPVLVTGPLLIGKAAPPCPELSHSNRPDIAATDREPLLPPLHYPRFHYPLKLWPICCEWNGQIIHVSYLEPEIVLLQLKGSFTKEIDLKNKIAAKCHIHINELIFIWRERIWQLNQYVFSDVKMSVLSTDDPQFFVLGFSARWDWWPIVNE